MGYISATVFIMWCRQYYRTARFICFAVSSWCIGLGVVCISFILLDTSRPLLDRLLDIIKSIFVYGMPFIWGLILQQCARRLRSMTNASLKP